MKPQTPTMKPQTPTMKPQTKPDEAVEVERAKGPRSLFVGRWVDTTSVRNPFAQAENFELDGKSLSSERLTDAEVGDYVRCEVRDGKAHIVERVAAQTSQHAALLKIAERLGLDPAYPDAVHREVAQIDATWNGLETGDALEDETHIPYVTIDNADSRDLDQALHIEQRADGFTVRYALADAAFFVRPGSALWQEALWRATSYYFPGFSIPMLPRALSEGLVSLNPNVKRRAMVMTMYLDTHAQCQRTTIRRAWIRSRHKLAYEGVQAFFDGQARPDLDTEVQASLQGLRAFGERRLKDANERNVVRYRRSEVEVRFRDQHGMQFVALTRPRNMTERYNEQLSLLCNTEGAAFIREGDTDDDAVHPIYRVHPAPESSRYERFEQMLRAIAQEHGHAWSWTRGHGDLASFLDDLPEEGAAGRLAQAIHRQAVMMNLRSSFSERPDRHYGVGAQAYARFSAPMREMVGVFLHKETWEKLDGQDTAGDAQTRVTIIEQANQAKMLQSQIAREANLLVLDEIFADHQRRSAPLHGTVVGITDNKAHVLLDDPAIDVKVYYRHLAGDIRPNASETAAMTADKSVLNLGDEVSLRVEGKDDGGRWNLQPGG